MDEQTQEQENFDNTSLVKEAALVEAKKKTGEAKSYLRRLVSTGKNQIKDQIKQELNPEQLVSKLQSRITNKVKSGLKGKGPRAKSKR